jgi:hypothetical protein
MKDSVESFILVSLGNDAIRYAKNPGVRMSQDSVRGQQEQVATAFYTLAFIVLCVLTVLMLTAASSRAREQDETAIWQSLAVRYLHEGDVDTSWDAPQTLRVAAFTLDADRERGAVLTIQPLDDLRTFDSSHFEMAANFTSELNCLSQAIYYESRGEAFVGQLAVAQVIMNRVRHPAYPDSICGVVYQGSDRTTGCQFSFTCDGSIMREPRGRAWRRSQLIAQHAFMGFGRDVTRRATHYHTVAVDPHWSGSLVRTRRIGTHIFYRFPTVRERSAGVVRGRDA